MAVQPLRNYKKSKERKILVISAGGEDSGIQGIYFSTNDKEWELLSQAIAPYPQRINNIIDACRRQSITTADLAWLDYKLTQLQISCARTVLAAAPRSQRKPHIAALNQLALYQGAIGEHDIVRKWNLLAGDPQLLAGTLGVPVMSDFSRYSLLSGGDGSLPLFDGNLMIARRFSTGTCVLINVGLLSHLTIIDMTQGRLLLDSDTGPGMCLINRCAREINSSEEFDRDGSEASKGTVDVNSLDALATAPWFMQNGPKEASLEELYGLLQKPILRLLAPNDRLATITALSARTVYDFYRSHCKEPALPVNIVLSGGGANNSSLMNYCKAYFGDIPIVTCDTMGIPVELRIPLSLGLSVDSFLTGNGTDGMTGTRPAHRMIGRITMP